ncbi:MAG TPA: AraC family transcriptional regulator [Verrucomicrobiae bacterium]|nr:AraC family transcriptional regulator [Verrucomicrobiae bacterium]
MTDAISQELLNALDLRVLAVQRTEAGRWWNFRHVISPFSRLWLILEGQATVTHHGRKFILKPGQAHLVPPFTLHDCSCSKRFNHFHLHFVARLPTGVDLFSLLDHPFQIPAGPDVLKHFQRLEVLYPDRKLPCYDPAEEAYRRQPLAIEQEERAVPAVDRFEGAGILMLLLTPFLRGARAHQGVHARATQQFLAVQEYIQAHMSGRICLRDLANAVQLHPTYFSDRFKEVVGVRPLEYLMRRRIERAQYLMLTSRASIKQIAVEVGIPDAAYFTRAFTRLCGKNPKEYRAAYAR